MSYLSSNAPTSVNIEVSDEFMVQEIQPNGVEIQKQPLSMSENFTRIIQRIDFEKLEKSLSDIDMNRTNIDEIDIPEVKIPVQSFIIQTQRPPNSAVYAPEMEPIKQKFTNALSHICVIHDVIKILREHNLIAFDHAPIKDPNPARAMVEQKPITILIAKKRGLQAASKIIADSLENMKDEQLKNGRSRIDFHQELLSMRQSWRLRKKGNTIIGDVSYRTAGSTDIQPARIEVVRNENQTPQNSSSLKLIVPKSLETVKYLIIKHVHNDDVKLDDFIEVNNHHSSSTTPLSSSSGGLGGPGTGPGTEPTNELHWNQRMESIQKSIYIKGLFCHLTNESVQLKLPIPTIATGNQVLITHFPGAQVSIKLCEADVGYDYRTIQEYHKHDLVMEHNIHQLLHDIYYRNLHRSLPHPTSSSLTLNSVRYIAGVNMYDRAQLTQVYHQDMILEQTIKQAKHSLLRDRVMYDIDLFVSTFKDLLIVPFWNYFGSATQCSVKIDIYSHGFEGMTGFRTSVLFHIGHQGIEAFLKDGRILNLSYNPHEFKYLMFSLISQHEITAVQSLAKSMGWKVISYSPHVGIGKAEPICGIASATLLLSPDGSKRLIVKAGPISGIIILYAQKLCDQDSFGKERQIKLEPIPGKSFIQKIEALLACLA